MNCIMVRNDLVKIYFPGYRINTGRKNSFRKWGRAEVLEKVKTVGKQGRELAVPLSVLPVVDDTTFINDIIKDNGLASILILSGD